MGTIRYAIALFLAKIVGLVLKITPMGNSEVPGALALRICPDFFEYISKPTKIVGVTGTNGKSSVVKLVSDCIMDTDIQVLNNAEGSSNPAGIAACLIRGVTLFGREKYGTAVLEMDALYSKEILPVLEPDILLVTLLARDSVARNGHPEYIRELINHYIPSGTKLLLNGDDLMSISVAPNNRRKFFGLKDMGGEKKINTNLIDDGGICPVCHKKVMYEYNRYSNIGKAFCPACGFTSPDYDYEGEILYGEEETGAPGAIRTLHISTDKREDSFPLIHESTYSIYNELAAIALMLEMGTRLMDIKKAMGKMSVSENMFKKTQIGSIKVNAIRTKDRDAYATSRVLEYVVSKPGYKEILLLNNSLKSALDSSEDCSWLYDCDFELLNNDKVDRVVVFGDRAKDYQLRLLMAGVREDKIVCVNDYPDAADSLLYMTNETIYILYGTDPVKVGKEVFDMVCDRIKTKENLVPADGKSKDRDKSKQLTPEDDPEEGFSLRELVGDIDLKGRINKVKGSIKTRRGRK